MASSTEAPPHDVAEIDSVFRPCTDTGNAEQFIDGYADLVRFDHARRRWLVWDTHRWRPDSDAAVHRMAIQSIRNRRKVALQLIDSLGPWDANEDAEITEARGRAKRAVAWALRCESRTSLENLLTIASRLQPIADAGKGWDETPGLLGVPNGVVDLRTGILRDGHPDDRITMCTGVDYDPLAECPMWESFLAEVLDDLDTVAYVQRMCGYSVTAEAVLHLLIFLMGTGRNGKGTFFRVLHRILGDYALLVDGGAFAEGRRNAHSTEVADLEGSRFAYCEELGDGQINADRLKDFSGGGMKKARKMRQDTRTFPQTWQLWGSTNGLPRTTDDSWGWWGRIRAIEFPHTYIGDRADPELESKLLAEAEGILAWIVRGAVAFYEGGMSEGPIPASVVEKTEQYRDDTDRLAPLFEAGYFVRCEDEVWTPMITLYAVYTMYAVARGIPENRRWSETTLGTLLSAQHTKKRPQVEAMRGVHKKLSGYHGIRVQDPVTGQPLSALDPATGQQIAASSWRYTDGVWMPEATPAAGSGPDEMGGWQG